MVFVLLAVWKLTMSVTLACIGLHRAVLQKRLLKDGFYEVKVSHAPFWWLMLYAAGVVVGMTGLGSLVVKTWSQTMRVHTVTYVFSAIVGTLVVVVVLVFIFLGEDVTDRFVWGGLGAVLTAIFAFGALSALYSDMVLAAIANNWSGAPFDDNKYIFWAWFAAKRLPILSL
ncbi:hypothetical protein H2203_005621 [Taxawa tesnikishii (nom. ined.)]|nr:hypothetical protein H2203_005621 [Dothideales sp. JES 119]